MLLGKIRYCMLGISQNDFLKISEKLSVLNVVKCARISFPFQLFFRILIILLRSIPLVNAFESKYEREQPFSISLQILSQSWSYPGPDPVSIQNLSRSWSYLEPDPLSVCILYCSWPYPGTVLVPEGKFWSQDYFTHIYVWIIGTLIWG